MKAHAADKMTVALMPGPLVCLNARDWEDLAKVQNCLAQAAFELRIMPLSLWERLTKGKDSLA